jgi:hypothetical protein
VFGSPSKKETRAALARIGALPNSADIFGNFFYVCGCRSGLWKSKTLPLKKGLDFEVLVAQVMADDVDLSRGPPLDELGALAHLVVEARNVFSGSRVCLGPYGDLLCRVLLAYGGAVDRVAHHVHGVEPRAFTADEMEPPAPRVMSEFLTRTGNRFAGALLGEPSTEDGELTATLGELADRLGHAPLLVRALVGSTPMVTRIHPQPGWAGSFAYEEFLEATGDADLSWGLTHAEPI